VVLGSVSHGAEILAKGHIHVYGSLNGRAFAGTNGDSHARIFCQKLKPELLSIAGQYLVREDIDDQWIDKIAQIYLDHEQLTVQHF
jgi:septum site-determining protein MinC